MPQTWTCWECDKFSLERPEKISKASKATKRQPFKLFNASHQIPAHRAGEFEFYEKLAKIREYVEKNIQGTQPDNTCA